MKYFFLRDPSCEELFSVAKETAVRKVLLLSFVSFVIERDQLSESLKRRTLDFFYFSFIRRERLLSVSFVPALLSGRERFVYDSPSYRDVQLLNCKYSQVPERILYLGYLEFKRKHLFKYVIVCFGRTLT